MTKREFIISRLPHWLSQQHRESYADEILKPGSYGGLAFELGVEFAMLPDVEPDSAPPASEK